MSKYSLFNKLGVSLLIIMLLLNIFGIPTVYGNNSKLVEIEDKFDSMLNDAEIRFKNIEDTWFGIKKDLTNLEKEQSELIEEIERVKNLSDLIFEKIQKTNEEIITIEDELNRLYVEIKLIEEDLSSREDEFRERIQSSSKLKFDNYIKVLLTSTKLSDFLSNFSFIKKIVDKDNQVIEEFLFLSDQLNKKKLEQDELFDELKVKAEELKELRKSLLKENEQNKKLYDDVGIEIANLLNDYRYYKVKYEEERNFLIELRKQKKLFDEFSEYITDRTGDYGLNTLVEYKRLELIDKAKDKGIELITTSGYRSFLEQNRLFNQGRNGNSGSIVTNAKGGQSWHNYGLAFDVVFNDGNGNPTWEQYDMNNNGIDDWEEIGELGESIGLEWGGRWEVLVDRPHFQMTFGKDILELYKIFTGGF